MTFVFLQKSKNIVETFLLPPLYLEIYCLITYLPDLNKGTHIQDGLKFTDSL